MVENLSRDPLREAVKSESAQIIAAPWDIASIPSERVTMPENWQLSPKPHPLIRG